MYALLSPIFCLKKKVAKPTVPRHVLGRSGKAETSLEWIGQFLIFHYVSSDCTTDCGENGLVLWFLRTNIFKWKKQKEWGRGGGEINQQRTRRMVSSGRDVLRGVQDEELGASGFLSHLPWLYQSLASRALLSLFIFNRYPSISDTWYRMFLLCFLHFCFYV